MLIRFCYCQSSANPTSMRFRGVHARRAVIVERTRMRRPDNDGSEPLLVECHLHGRQVSAVVCRHMLQLPPPRLGVIENSNDPYDLQAWCHLCEDMYQQQGGLTEVFDAFNDMSIVCVLCYAQLKQRHHIALN